MEHLDNLLNKYIDNEISESELNELKNSLEFNTDLQIRFESLKKVDLFLNKLEPESAPLNFTSKFMNELKVNDSSLDLKKDLVFIKWVVSIISFVLIITLVLAFLIESNYAGNSIVFNFDFKNWLDKFSLPSLSILKNKMFLILTTTVSLIFIFVSYFVAEDNILLNRIFKSIKD